MSLNRKQHYPQTVKKKPVSKPEATLSPNRKQYKRILTEATKYSYIISVERVRVIRSTCACEGHVTYQTGYHVKKAPF